MKNGYKTTSNIDMPKEENMITLSKADFDYMYRFNFIIGILCGCVSTMTILLTVFTFIIKDLSS
jgi:hypothetical protein